ncbi:hypothetical protein ScPMuIL_003351 [Solemya velum]
MQGVSLRGPQSSRDWYDKAVADELKVEVGAVLSDRVKRARKDEITDVKNRVANLKKELHKLETEQIDSINEHIQELKQALETMRVDLVSRVSYIVKQETDSLNKMERNLKRTEQTLTRIYDDTVQLLTKANNVEVVSKAYDLKEEIGEILGTDLSLPSRGAAYDAKFVAGTIDFDILREMCGEIVMPAVTGLGAVGRSGDHAAKTISNPAGTGLGAVGGSGAHITKKMPQYGDGQDGQGAAANSGPSKTKISGQIENRRTMHSEIGEDWEDFDPGIVRNESSGEMISSQTVTRSGRVSKAYETGFVKC